MGKTSIEWTRGADGSDGETWNCLRGCSRISPGCGGPHNVGGCYAERIASRFSDPGQPFHGYAKRTPDGGRWTGKVGLIHEKIREPLTWRKPRKVFVNSMSDLFHEALAFDDIDRVFGVMHACEFLGRDAFPGHVFQVLTKRVHRMREYFSTDRRSKWARWACEYGGEPDPDPLYDQIAFRESLHPRIWLGVSVEDQQRADERIPELLKTPASVRFLSCEPLIGPIRLSFPSSGCVECGVAETRCDEDGCCVSCGVDVPRATEPVPDWVIIGSESGPGARPMNVAWARSLVDQCVTEKVAVFTKQIATVEAKRSGDAKGGDPIHWPEGYWPRQFPEVRL